MGFKAANRESFPYIMHVVGEPRKFSPSNVLSYTVSGVCDSDNFKLLGLLTYVTLHYKIYKKSFRISIYIIFHRADLIRVHQAAHWGQTLDTHINQHRHVYNVLKCIHDGQFEG